eukprot:Skav228468  [mRNA]  locus=scaffold1233:81474:82736:+ [translate_table: standard]
MPLRGAQSWLDLGGRKSAAVVEPLLETTGAPPPGSPGPPGSSRQRPRECMLRTRRQQGQELFAAALPAAEEALRMSYAVDRQHQSSEVRRRSMRPRGHGDGGGAGLGQA